LLAQSPFGLIWSSYRSAPRTGDHLRFTSSIGVAVVFGGDRGTGTEGHWIE
jgi:hypothetical protein